MEDNVTDQILLYQTDDGRTEIEVDLQDDTVWLSQSQMASLFEKNQSVIARHIINIFKEGELDTQSNMQILHNTLSKYKPTKVYSLDVIISVGYRVKSLRGTQFRIWANKVLKEYLLDASIPSTQWGLMNDKSRLRLSQDIFPYYFSCSKNR